MPSMACPTCANRKPNPAANQDDERRHRANAARRTPCPPSPVDAQPAPTPGRTHPGGAGASRHASTSSGPSPGTRLGGHSRTAARRARRRRRLRGGAGVAPPPPGRARAARRPGRVHAAGDGGAARRARCERAALVYAATGLTIDTAFPAACGLLFAIMLVRLFRAPLFVLPLALAGADVLENLTVAALALGHAGDSVSGSRWPSTSAVGRRALSGRVRVRDHFDAPLEAGRAGDPGRVRACGAARKGARPAGGEAGAACDTGGPNGRCRRDDAGLRPCGRRREVRIEPGVALSRGPLAGGAGGVLPWRSAWTGAKAAAGAMRHARRSAGAGSGAAWVATAPVTAPAGVAGADWCERGSDRRHKRPCGQWRQGDC